MSKRALVTILSITAIALIIALISYDVYLKNQIASKNNTINDKDKQLSDSQVQIYNYINNSKIKIEDNPLLDYLFVDKSVKDIYDGGPSHWGSRIINVKNVTQDDTSKTLVLNVTDESNLKGDTPPKQWEEKWLLNSDGLYIDNYLMIKLPFDVGTNWQVNDYVPSIVDITDKYKANIKITNISQIMGANTKLVKQITTELTIDDLKMVDNRKYTETTVYETSKGIVKKTITSPSTANLDLQYFFENQENI